MLEVVDMYTAAVMPSLRQSAERADNVESTAQPHVLVIDWRGSPPAPNKKMAAARDARYAALSAACTAHGIDALLVAHTAGARADAAACGACIYLHHAGSHSWTPCW